MFDDSKVSYSVRIFPEDTEVRGNYVASGDDDYDRGCENEILAELANGNDWAWCTVKVTAQYEGINCIEGNDFLGCCSYRDEADFLACDYYKDMCACARYYLYEQLEGILARFNCLNPADNPECIE